jgi:hypothetical protein
MGAAEIQPLEPCPDDGFLEPTHSELPPFSETGAILPTFC